MKLDVDLSALQRARQAMGASVGTWVPDRALREIAEVRERLKEGIEARDLSSVSVSNGGLLECEGQQIALYIIDHVAKPSVVHDPESGKRVHVYDCSTLREMRASGRYDRYVQTIETGPVRVDVGTDDRPRADLKVCQNCLRALNYKGYAGGNTDVWRNFDRAEFFEQYSTFFAVPAAYSDYAAPDQSYTRDWSRISLRQRAEAKWRCSECRADLSAPHMRRHLHVHHVNGVKSDNRSRNLVALCAVCHACQPSHQHMRVEPAVADAIARCRPSS